MAREEFPVASELLRQSKFAGPMKQFLVVVLPDGKIVTTSFGE
jgi:hypothetical protein